MTEPSNEQRHGETPAHDVPTKGRLVPLSRFYDLMTAILSMGRESRMRRRTVELARVAPGERVLEVGCGTGSLAIAAKAAAGPEGEVFGIDPSKQMVRSARRKAARKRVNVRFDSAAAEKLSFADGEFDVVLCSLVLHHLPPDVKAAALGEIRRVLKPGGRFVAVDFGPNRAGLLGHFVRHHGHSGDRPDELSELLAETGLLAVESGPLGLMGLVYWRSAAPGVVDTS